jgi:hypothetical protein
MEIWLNGYKDLGYDWIEAMYQVIFGIWKGVDTSFENIATWGGGYDYEEYTEYPVFYRPFSFNVYNHYAIVVLPDRIKTFINGILFKEYISGGFNVPYYEFYIDNEDGSKLLIDALSITKGAKYTENFTPPTEPPKTKAPNEDLSGIGDILWTQSCLSFGSSHFVVCNKKAYKIATSTESFQDHCLAMYNIVTKKWDYVSAYPGYSDFGHSIVAVGNIIYVGMGSTFNSLIEGGYPREWYKYDTVANQWTKLADFAREPVGINGLQGMACEHVNGKIYVGLGAGNQSGGSENYWYAYDIAANSWATMAVCPVTNYGNSYDGERYPFHGVIDDKIYVGGGTANKPPYPILKTWLCYDTATDSWTTIGNVPFDSLRGDCIALNGEIYCSTNKQLYVFNGAGWKEVSFESVCGYLSITEVTSK